MPVGYNKRQSTIEEGTSAKVLTAAMRSRRRSSTRRSPAQPAGKTKLRTIKTGKDGKKWIVAQRVNGTHFWRRL